MAKTKQKPTIREKALPPTGSWKAYSVVYPTSTPITANGKKRAVRKAHEKHRYDLTLPPQLLPTSSYPSLADRFHALPSELRARIFSFLLVQPVKWDITHQPGCPRLTSNADITPKAPQGYSASTHLWIPTHWPGRVDKLPCATQFVPEQLRRCRFLLVGKPESGDIWVSPWRSLWAPEQKNPYVCTNCYDRVRERPFPKARNLPCLCARRSNLEILLVCKQWYSEAATVLYTLNTFAFEDATSFVAFTQSLKPRRKSLLSKVSIMATTTWKKRPDEVDVSNQWIIESDGRPNMWTLLRSLPQLSYLELDLSFILHPASASAASRLGHRNLGHVRFVQRVPEQAEWTNGTPEIWPQFAGRTLRVGGLVEEIARAMKGQRQRHLKGAKVFKERVRDLRWAMEKKSIGL